MLVHSELTEITSILLKFRKSQVSSGVIKCRKKSFISKNAQYKAFVYFDMKSNYFRPVIPKKLREC